MNPFKHNQEAWDHQVEAHNRWTVPVPAEVIAAAKKGNWSARGKGQATFLSETPILKRIQVGFPDFPPSTSRLLLPAPPRPRHPTTDKNGADLKPKSAVLYDRFSVHCDRLT
jgi:hypothetical protein